MFTTLKNAWKIKDIRKRLLFTLVVIVIIRLCAQIPTPGVNNLVFKNWFDAQTEAAGALGFLNSLTGGSFSRMSIVALSITPYITSSIIIQLLTIAIPRLEEMQKDGEEGRKKIREMTRYIAVALAALEGFAIGVGFSRSGYLYNNNILGIIIVMITLAAGSTFLMWLGEITTEKGIGNGISIILMVNILSGIPADMANLFSRFVINSSNIVTGGLAAIVIIAIIVLMIVFIVYLSDGERRIPVQYSKKVVGRNMVGGNSTSIPLKVNTAGVIPIIFASSIMSIPSIISSIAGSAPSGVLGQIIKFLSTNYWFNFNEPIYTLGIIVYILLVIFFAYFYTQITFNPIEVADNIKRQGGFIPGIRPGKPTQDYLTNILKSLIFIGAVGLLIVAIVPIFFSGAFNASVSFGGTSLIIIIGVILETMKQIESMMLVRHYKGFISQ